MKDCKFNSLFEKWNRKRIYNSINTGILDYEIWSNI